MSHRAAIFSCRLIAAAAIASSACSGNDDTTPTEGGAADVIEGGTADVTNDVASDSPIATDSGPTPDTGVSWPDCQTAPTSATQSTIPKVWTDDPTSRTETWLSGVYVTAVSNGACSANTACTFFVQQDLSYADLSAAAHHAIKVLASAQTSTRFVGIAVGDRVDLLGWAWRYNLGGQNELLLEVDTTFPGCFKKVGTGTATPTLAQLTDFSITAYEQTTGPVLVEVDAVSGVAQSPNTTIGLFKTGQLGDASVQNVTSLSPFYLSGAVFTGLSQGTLYKFTSVTGVFGLFVPPTDGGSPTKYEEIYARTMSDVVH
jgi:hypothetical protein